MWRDSLKIPFATWKALHCYVNSCILLRRKWRKSCESADVQGHLGFSTDWPRRKGEKKREWETPVSPLASIVIPLTIQQVGWNQCGLASAVVRSALRSSVLELWASLLPVAHRFSRDPEHGLPQRLTNFITTFSQLCTENQTNLPIQALPLTSYLISDIMGKSDLCEQEPFKIHGKWGHVLGWWGTSHGFHCSKLVQKTRRIIRH